MSKRKSQNAQAESPKPPDTIRVRVTPSIPGSVEFFRDGKPVKPEDLAFKLPQHIADDIAPMYREAIQQQRLELRELLVALIAEVLDKETIKVVTDAAHARSLQLRNTPSLKGKK